MIQLSISLSTSLMLCSLSSTFCSSGHLKEAPYLGTPFAGRFTTYPCPRGRALPSACMAAAALSSSISMEASASTGMGGIAPESEQQPLLSNECCLFCLGG